MENTALLEGLASYSTAHQDILYGRPLGEKTIMHKQSAIQQINLKLMSSFVEDSTIFAVAQLGITMATIASTTVLPTTL